MNFILLILFIVMLSGIVISDLKHYAIPVYLLIPMLAIAFIRSLIANSAEIALKMALMNLLLIIPVILLSVLIIYALRRNIFNPVNSLIGAGDLVFIPAVCLSFSPINFIVFFVSSLLIIILFRLFVPGKGRFIPLAGLLSMMLGIVLVLSEITSFDLFSDRPLLTLIP